MKPLPEAPAMEMIRNVVTPTLTIYQPTRAKRKGTAIIVFPGGRFRILDSKIQTSADALASN